VQTRLRVRSPDSPVPVPLRASVAGAIGWGALVFVGLIVSWLGVTSTQQTLSQTAQTRHLVVLSDAWKRVRIWLVEEETRERKYLVERDRLDGGAYVNSKTYESENVHLDRPYHQVAVRTLEKLLAQLRAESPSADFAEIDRISDDNARYGKAMLAMFDASDRHDRAAVGRVHFAIDPTYDDMEARIRRFEERYGHEDYLALAALERTQFRVAVLFPYLVGLLGLGAIATFLVFRHLGKRANAMVAQNMQRLEAAALVDGLTGLGNHRAFREAFDRPGDRGGSACHLALVDIDHFKSFNDRFGHAHGDGVLREVAMLLAHEDARAFRIGGDEFVMVFEGRTTAAVLAVLERIGSDAPKRFRGSLSIGVAERSARVHIDSVYERADIALYEAKHRGRNTVVVFDSTMIAGTSTLASRRLALERVLAGGHPVAVAFQPIRTLDGETIGYEALARFTHTFTTPLEAFATAARLERTAELDACCIDGVATAIEPSFSGALFINVSPRTLAPISRSSGSSTSALAPICRPSES